MAHTTQVATLSDTEILISRRFDAPRRLVFECMHKPEYIREWLLGPEGWTMPVCEVDFRVGGKYRYEWASADGRRMGMGGVYREIVAPERVVSTEIFDVDWTGGETVNVATLTEKAGTTTLEIRVKYSTRQARDGALATGMTEGMEAGFKRLETMLASMAAQQGDGR